jgi:hypothetical protein
VYNRGVARAVRPPVVDYDVFICCREPSGTPVARALADGLSRLGFVVCLQDRGSGGPEAARVQAIEDAPDFLLVLTDEALATVHDERDPVRVETAHALRHGRVVVPVCLPGVVVPPAERLPADIEGIAVRTPMMYDPERRAASLALVSHSLSSDPEVEDRKVMRRARHAAMLAGFIVIAAAASFVVPTIYRAVTAPQPLPPLAPFAVSWAGIVQRTQGERVETLDLEDGLEVMAGDRVKLIFSPGATGVAYVLARSAGGDVTVLYPPHMMRGASGVTAGRTYEAPAARNGLLVGDAAGPDTIVLIVGYDPMENLEELCEEADARAPAGERSELLASAIAGLIDGRHRLAARQPRTRFGQAVDAKQPPMPVQERGSVTVRDGSSLDRPMRAERGLISVAVEIRLRPQAVR